MNHMKSNLVHKFVKLLIYNKKKTNTAVGIRGKAVYLKTDWGITVASQEEMLLQPIFCLLNQSLWTHTNQYVTLTDSLKKDENELRHI